MDSLMIWLNGKKTYLTALAFLVCGILANQGVTIPEYVWAALGALGLGFLRVGVAKSAPAETNNMVKPASKGSKIAPFLALGLGLSLVLSAGGCTGLSNGQKYILTCQTVEATAKTITTLDKAGAFGTADRARIKAMGKLAKTLILKMRDDLIGGDTSMNFSYLLTQLQTVLDELLRMQLQAEAAQTAREISNGTIDSDNYRIDGGTEHGLAAGQGGSRVSGDGQSADPRGDRHSDDGGGRCSGRDGCAAWRTPCPVLLLSLVPEVEFD